MTRTRSRAASLAAGTRHGGHAPGVVLDRSLGLRYDGRVLLPGPADGVQGRGGPRPPGGRAQVHPGSLHNVAPRLYHRLADNVPKHQSVCIVAYTGHFTVSVVSKPLGRPAGTLAVAVVTTPGIVLLGTLILTKIPVRFQHMF